MLFARLPSSSFRPSLTLFSLPPLLITAVILWFGVPAVLNVIEARPAGDLRYIIDAGNVLTDENPAGLYERNPESVNRSVQLAQEGGYVYPHSYPYTPSFGLAMVPLAKASDRFAGNFWMVLTIASTLVLAGLVASTFRGWSWRLLVAASVICWEPLLLNARIGQTGALVAGASAIAFVVFLRNRNLGAVLLGLLVFKPTAALAPFFLIFPERMGVWARFYGVVTFVAFVPFIWLGPDALFGWIDILTDRAVVDLSGGHVYNQGLSAVINLKNPVGVFLVAWMLLLLALLVSSVETRLGIAAAAALTIYLALVLNPHSLLYDWGVAFVGILLIRSGGLFPEKLADACAGALALSLFVAGQLVWHENQVGEQLHLLTVWTVLVVGSLVVLALSPWLRERLASLPDSGAREPAPAKVPQPVAPVRSAGAGRSSRAARRKSRRIT